MALTTTQGASRGTFTMKKSLSILAVVALLVTPPLAVPQAAAEHEYDRGYYGGGADWVFAAAIGLGRFRVSIGYQPTRHGPPTYYYRTNHAIHYDGYGCGDRCFRRSQTYYHHEQCPVLLHLLHVNRLHPHRIFAHHAPDYDGRWTSYDPYDWHRGYARSRGRQWDDRYDDRDRYYDSRQWRDRRGDDDRHRGRGRGRGHRRH